MKAAIKYRIAGIIGLMMLTILTAYSQKQGDIKVNLKTKAKYIYLDTIHSELNSLCKLGQFDIYLRKYSVNYMPSEGVFKKYPLLCSEGCFYNDGPQARNATIDLAFIGFTSKLTKANTPTFDIGVYNFSTILDQIFIGNDKDEIKILTIDKSHKGFQVLSNCIKSTETDVIYLVWNTLKVKKLPLELEDATIPLSDAENQSSGASMKKSTETLKEVGKPAEVDRSMEKFKGKKIPIAKYFFNSGLNNLNPYPELIYLADMMLNDAGLALTGRSATFDDSFIYFDDSDTAGYKSIKLENPGFVRKELKELFNVDKTDFRPLEDSLVINYYVKQEPERVLYSISPLREMSRLFHEEESMLSITKCMVKLFIGEKLIEQEVVSNIYTRYLYINPLITYYFLLEHDDYVRKRYRDPESNQISDKIEIKYTDLFGKSILKEIYLLPDTATINLTFLDKSKNIRINKAPVPASRTIKVPLYEFKYKNGKYSYNPTADPYGREEYFNRFWSPTSACLTDGLLLLDRNASKKEITLTRKMSRKEYKLLINYAGGYPKIQVPYELTGFLTTDSKNSFISNYDLEAKNKIFNYYDPDSLIQGEEYYLKLYKPYGYNLCFNGDTLSWAEPEISIDLPDRTVDSVIIRPIPPLDIFYIDLSEVPDINKLINILKESIEKQGHDFLIYISNSDEPIVVNNDRYKLNFIYNTLSRIRPDPAFLPVEKNAFTRMSSQVDFYEERRIVNFHFIFSKSFFQYSGTEFIDNCLSNTDRTKISSIILYVNDNIITKDQQIKIDALVGKTGEDNVFIKVL